MSLSFLPANEDSPHSNVASDASGLCGAWIGWKTIPSTLCETCDLNLRASNFALISIGWYCFFPIENGLLLNSEIPALAALERAPMI